jgi:hypothetical protein
MPRVTPSALYRPQSLIHTIVTFDFTCIHLATILFQLSGGS